MGPQIWEVYPALEPFIIEQEKHFSKVPGQTWMQANSWFPITVVVVYLIFIYIGPSLLKNSPAWKLDSILALWNLSLSIFSFWGASRTVPHLIHFLTIKSFEETVCDFPAPLWGYGSTGIAVLLFCLSKIPETLDTVLIVLRKKPLTFLHWYHHVSVLLFCWNSYVTESAAGLYFVAMNYTVHTVMYFYYFARSVHIVPRDFPSWTITMLQITQFIIGTIVVCAGIYYYLFGGRVYAPRTCHNKISNMAAGAIMYASYLCLFVDFALRRFVFKKRGGSSSKAALKHDAGGVHSSNGNGSKKLD